MQTYVNKFNIALNQDKSEALVDFFQNVPVIPQNNEAMNITFDTNLNTEVIPVVNLVMTGECARQLAMTLLALLGQEPPSE